MDYEKIPILDEYFLNNNTSSGKIIQKKPLVITTIKSEDRESPRPNLGPFTYILSGVPT